MKKANDQKNVKEENKKIFGLIITLLIVMLTIYLILKAIDGGVDNSNYKSVENIIKDNDTAVIYVENSDKKKCNKCNTMKKYLDTKKVEYILYDAKKYSKKEYTKMLQSLNINVSDFNYPAIIYIKDGSMYSNIINIDSTKVIEQFIKDYNLKKINNTK